MLMVAAVVISAISYHRERKAHRRMLRGRHLEKNTRQ